MRKLFCLLIVFTLYSSTVTIQSEEIPLIREENIIEPLENLKNKTNQLLIKLEDNEKSNNNSNINSNVK